MEGQRRADASAATLEDSMSQPSARRSGCQVSYSTPAFDALEARCLLASGPLSVEAYYPEGYSNNSINEYVPMTNHGDTEVEYELHARYEWGERDQLIAAGRIGPHSRGGVTISEAGKSAQRLVRDDVPY